MSWAECSAAQPERFPNDRCRIIDASLRPACAAVVAKTGTQKERGDRPLSTRAGERRRRSRTNRRCTRVPSTCVAGVGRRTRSGPELGDERIHVAGGVNRPGAPRERGAYRRLHEARQQHGHYERTCDARRTVDTIVLNYTRQFAAQMRNYLDSSSRHIEYKATVEALLGQHE
jgi:hypothetical protein